MARRKSCSSQRASSQGFGQQQAIDWRLIESVSSVNLILTKLRDVLQQVVLHEDGRALVQKAKVLVPRKIRWTQGTQGTQGISGITPSVRQPALSARQPTPGW